MKPTPAEDYWIYSEGICSTFPLMSARFVEPSRTYPNGRWYTGGQYYTAGKDIVVVSHIRRPSPAAVKKALAG